MDARVFFCVFDFPLFGRIDKYVFTTRKTSSCGGPIAAGAKTAAICRLLRRIFGPPLYMRSIAAFFVTAAIGRVFCGVL